MIRPGPEKHGVWPNLSLDNALLILGVHNLDVRLMGIETLHIVFRTILSDFCAAPARAQMPDKTKSGGCKGSFHPLQPPLKGATDYH